MTSLARALLVLLSPLAASAGAQIAFEAPIHSAGPHFALRLLVGDINEDGQSDVITGNFQFQDPAATAMLGLGDGRFAAPQTVAFDQPYVLADFDGDLHLDLITADTQGQGPVVLRSGNGLGAFAGATSIDTNAVSVAASDFNGDGALDVVVGHGAAGFSAGSVTASLGNGHGGFSSPATVLLSVASPILQVLVGDTNDDGHDDLVLRLSFGSNVMLGLGNGQFTPAPCHDCLMLDDADVVLADLDGDGRTDALTPTRALLAAADGNFETAVLLPPGPPGSSIAAADLDGDGHADAVVASAGGVAGCVRLLRGLGNGSFSSPGLTIDHVGQSHLAIADLDADGRMDVVACKNSEIQGLLNHTYGAGSPFLDLGGSLAGANGHPILLANGTLLPASPYSFKIYDGPPAGLAVFFAGFTAINLPFKGGVLVPAPNLRIGPVPLNTAGSIVLGGTWPGGASGATFWLQSWMPNGGGPASVVATNAVRGQVP